MYYGNAPQVITENYFPQWDEYMHYMYLPIQFAEYGWALRLPENIRAMEGVTDLIEDAIEAEFQVHGRNNWNYVYLTARRGFATPGNPLNRPGWHSDGFGTNDVNYVWTDRYPTEYAVMDFGTISADHTESLEQFEDRITDYTPIARYPNGTMLRLDQSVIHRAPEIPAPGGERSFLKVTFSNSKYNLKGNSHNYLYDYNWEMYDRKEVRNDPARGNTDSI